MVNEKIMNYFEQSGLGKPKEINQMADWKRGKRYMVIIQKGLFRNKSIGYTVYEEKGEIVTVKRV